MEPTSPPKHAASLGARLNQKIDEDAAAVVSLTRKRLEQLANDSSSVLKSSLGTAITDIESQLERLRKRSWSLWSWTLIVGIVLGLIVAALSGYAWWKWTHIQRLRAQEQRIEAQLKALPPSFQVKRIQGKWYLIAPRIDYRSLTYTNRHGAKENAVRLIP